MKKIALVFLLAVFVPSLVLAWLAVRSLRDQQLVLERQQSLLYQGVADALARQADGLMADRQNEFGWQVDSLLSSNQSGDLIFNFDSRLRTNWPLAEVGFVVTESCALLCPSPDQGPVAKTFYDENQRFLCSTQPAEVYLNNAKNVLNGANNGSPLDAASANNSSFANNSITKSELRKVMPQQQTLLPQADNNVQQFSKVAPAEAEFRKLVGESNEGTVSRFLENKHKILVWYRSRRSTQLIFGSQLSLPRLKESLAPVVQQLDPALRDDIAVALLDDNAKPVAVSLAGFQTNWKHPFVATELGEALPHWEMAVYVRNPAKLAESVRILKCTIGLLVAVLIITISVGGWLIVADLNRQLVLSRQKTDFVSNVSHELKTPLTSIRMFSELLAEGRVSDPGKSQSYLHIITAETSRLTRLINNVLDFSRLERGETKYNFQPCDLAVLLREIVATYRPHLEANGFAFRAELPETPIPIHGDRDALAQVLLNLLSNAEKYSLDRKEITVQLAVINGSKSVAEVRIIDRGSGVPKGCAEKIFEQFYRAHDSLNSGIQGSGLGLTLARQIARAHGGDVLYRPGEGGGSCFTFRLPLAQSPKPAA